MYSSIHYKSASGRSKSVNWRVLRVCLGYFTSKLLAASFAAAGFGLWIIPSDAPSELMILKLAISVFFILLAAVFYTGGRNFGSDAFHIDTKRREIRHILRGNDGIARLQARYSFAEAGGSATGRRRHPRPRQIGARRAEPPLPFGRH